MNVALESMNAPQLAATYAVTGKVQTPSEAMDIQNPYGAFVVDALLDPAVAFGVGKGLVKGLPTKNMRFFKEDWLRGYKPIEVPKSNFKSEIDWGKWNPDTPKYPELINEYNAIEKATKQSGTWMKNPDGSPFQGTPEQFIQEQSSYFKKAYPEGYDLTYRGVDKFNNNPDFSQPRDTSLPSDRGIFTADRELASYFISGNNKDILTPFSSRESPGLYELIHPKGKQIDFHTQTSDWTEIDLSKNTTKADLQQRFNEERDFVDKIGVGVDPIYLQSYYNRLSKIKKDIDEVDNLNSDAATFSEMRSKLGDRVSTDEIAAYLPETDLRKVKLRDIVDGNFGDVTIVNNRPGNYLKSRVGNVGFFDMTNPNIYKAVAPIGAGIGVGASQLNKKKSGMQMGGTMSIPGVNGTVIASSPSLYKKYKRK
jgi:hypothetical protein